MLSVAIILTVCLSGLIRTDLMPSRPGSDLLWLTFHSVSDNADVRATSFPSSRPSPSSSPSCKTSVSNQHLTTTTLSNQASDLWRSRKRKSGSTLKVVTRKHEHEILSNFIFETNLHLDPPNVPTNICTFVTFAHVIRCVLRAFLYPINGFFCCINFWSIKLTKNNVAVLWTI